MIIKQEQNGVKATRYLHGSSNPDTTWPAFCFELAGSQLLTSVVTELFVDSLQSCARNWTSSWGPWTAGSTRSVRWSPNCRTGFAGEPNFIRTTRPSWTNWPSLCWPGTKNKKWSKFICLFMHANLWITCRWGRTRAMFFVLLDSSRATLIFIRLAIPSIRCGSSAAGICACVRACVCVYVCVHFPKVTTKSVMNAS